MRKVNLFSFFFIMLIVTIPVFSFNFDLSGRYIVKHHSNSNNLLNKQNVRDSYSSMELMMKPIFVINNNIKLTLEFTALQNHIWGNDAQPSFQQDDPFLFTIDSGNNIDWKSAYLTLRTKIGGFLIGRGIEKKWGTGLGDSTGSHGDNSKHKDGILWVVPVGNFISGFGWQHIFEGDKGSVISDADFDKTYLFSAFKKENWHSGLLLARYDHKNFVVLEELRNFQIGYNDFKKSLGEYKKASAVFGLAYKASENMEEKGYYYLTGLSSKAEREGYDSVTKWELEKAGTQISDETNGIIAMRDLHDLMLDADIAQAVATSAGAKIKDGPERSNLELWVIDPYFIADFNSYKIEFEFLYGWGKIDFDGLKLNFQEDDSIGFLDVEGLAATVGLWRKFDIFSIGSGVTYVQGDNDSYSDGKFSGIGYLEPSLDFERGFLLNSDISKIGLQFGGSDNRGINLGNLSSGPTSIAGTSGYKMFWIETKYFVSNNLSFKVICLNSHADAQPEGWNSNHGLECNFVVKWNLMDNLTFDGVFAYLDAGKFWEANGYNSNLNNMSTLYGKLTLDF